MKPRTVKTKVVRLSQHFGSRKAFAEAIGIHISYVSKIIKHNMVPGKRLYADICDMYDSIYDNRKGEKP